ncbi:Phage integrase family protein [Desulfotomaculum arcticum]|uniref:Phage integrase family protein n=1 Tax=Desulfotruncus arcticus DSM 17038 TaxID=1121424 RepID=A0A1I2ZFH7_9FIRM|nr:tyrosine-type recombinase/integrase [Desulfotruncus arcticus]SFH36588.1 Phage integrase family protein [Desulfotomaculum arcticum] [Desulfotruncus arcticus DSM 17038]
MARIFKAIDLWEDSFYTNRNLIDPIFFRLLYGTGMRVSEALNLLVKDFNPAEGILTVYHAKNNKDRLVPLSLSLSHQIMELAEKIHKFSKDTDYLFPSINGSRIDLSNYIPPFQGVSPSCRNIPYGCRSEGTRPSPQFCCKMPQTLGSGGRGVD